MIFFKFCIIISLFHGFIISSLNLKMPSHWLIMRLNEPLSTAIKQSDLHGVQTLLNQGADPNYPDALGNTPLISAIKNNKTKPKIIAALLSKGADVNFQDFEGNTAVHLAIYRSRPTVLMTLLTAGPDPFIKNQKEQKASDINRTKITYVGASEESRQCTQQIITEYEKEYEQQFAIIACMKECKRLNTGIFHTIRNLLETENFPQNNEPSRLAIRDEKKEQEDRDIARWHAGLVVHPKYADTVI